MLQHKDGGYSFKPAVLHCPSAFPPIADALGLSFLTLCLWRLSMSCGRFKRSKLVGLGDIAPMSHWQNLIFSTLGSSNRMGAAEGTSVGSAGCSMRAYHHQWATGPWRQGSQSPIACCPHIVGVSPSTSRCQNPIVAGHLWWSLGHV